MYQKRSFAVNPRTFGGFFEDVLQNGWNRVQEEASAYVAPVNIQETNTSYEMQLVAPGVKKEEFKINVDKNILNISYEHKTTESAEPAEAKELRTEFAVKSFKRSFTLSDKIDATKIAAKYTDGILNISLTKKEEAEPTSQDIAIN